MADEIERIAGWVRNARCTVAFTGAGISTESGIPDFRSPGGVWSRSEPVYFNDFLSSASARYEYWKQKAESHRDFFDSKPNAAHTVLARWESAGLLRAVITQNIDGLHSIAGNREVLELHGTAREVACLECSARFPAEEFVLRFEETDSVPLCPECGGITKHATISFGQSLPADVLSTAVGWAQRSDLFLAMGSSLVVEPAAGLPRIAKHNGARLIIINRETTPLDDLADAIIRAPLGRCLAEVDQVILRREFELDKDGETMD